MSNIQALARAVVPEMKLQERLHRLGYLKLSPADQTEARDLCNKRRVESSFVAPLGKWESSRCSPSKYSHLLACAAAQSRESWPRTPSSEEYHSPSEVFG